DRARWCEVHAAAIRSRDGAIRHSARRRRAAGDLPHGEPKELMATEVKLPRLGQGMESGTIVKWLKSEGEAEASGVLLKIAISAGEVEVGKTIGFIGAEGESVAAEEAPATAEQPTEAPAREAEPAPAVEAQPSNGSTNGRIKASPLARRIARERGVDLAQITGTGPDGRIVAEDIERAQAQ